MGSAAFGNVARAALGFIHDPEGEDEDCVISQVKNNLGKLNLPSLKYRIDGVTVPTDEGPASVGVLTMLGESDRSVADILRDGRGRHGEDQSDLAEAQEWLIMFLTDTALGYAPAREVMYAGEASGFPKHTLQRARKRAKIRTIKAGFGGGWVWCLPGIEPHEDDAQGDEDDSSRENVIFVAFGVTFGGLPDLRTGAAAGPGGPGSVRTLPTQPTGGNHVMTTEVRRPLRDAAASNAPTPSHHPEQTRSIDFMTEHPPSRDVRP
jgi:hypothetical protein